MLRTLRLRTRIAAKWRSDRHELPLTPAHRELYYYIHRAFWRALGRFPNLIDCYDHNEKIQWLKLFDQSEEIVRCTDKILVRDYVRERVGEKYLVKLYQVHEHFSQIDLDLLPDAFVVKSNNDSGCVILVEDKSKFDRDAAEKQIEKALKRPYGSKSGEWSYSYIVPRVLVEEYIDPHNESLPPDYKIYCVDGQARFCQYVSGRGFDIKEQIVDVEGSDLAVQLTSYKPGKDFVKPDAWEEMICVAEKLGYRHKLVRVDLYCFHDNIYVGEMTFWPYGGRYKGEGQKELGKYLDFDRSTYKPVVIRDLEKRRSRFDIYPTRFRRLLKSLCK